MTYLVRLVFVNDVGVSGVPHPVELDVMPEVGTMMISAVDAGIPESIVIKIVHGGSNDLKELVELMYGPEGNDGLPLIVCKIPDGWDPSQFTPPSVH